MENIYIETPLDKMPDGCTECISKRGHNCGQQLDWRVLTEIKGICKDLNESMRGEKSDALLEFINTSNKLFDDGKSTDIICPMVCDSDKFLKLMNEYSIEDLEEFCDES